MTDLCLPRGIGSQELQGIGCLIDVWPNSTAVHMHQVGWWVGILQSLKELSRAESVSIGPLAAVSGLGTSEFATVALSSYIICHHHQPVAYVTVETVEKVK